jgi:hypothetical protein
MLPSLLVFVSPLCKAALVKNQASPKAEDGDICHGKNALASSQKTRCKNWKTEYESTRV